jgi:hypothetical protein
MASHWRMIIDVAKFNTKKIPLIYGHKFGPSTNMLLSKKTKSLRH